MEENFDVEGYCRSRPLQPETYCVWGRGMGGDKSNLQTTMVSYDGIQGRARKEARGPLPPDRKNTVWLRMPL